ncbi:Hypothetical protein TR210_673 [Trichococcus ilyis]|uniref:Uncharacterized protein n=1 Tax=Trichococcus ilyis TaxID=640938 RepID=A0A143YFA6_9LACT|nr:Hypothetical protein TR210_673 [Trichococcus ilyis]
MLFSCFYYLCVFISIHALTRSATYDVSNFLSLPSYFNPRTHEECDHIFFLCLLRQLNFNPRTHEECDWDGLRGYEFG